MDQRDVTPTSQSRSLKVIFLQVWWSHGELRNTGKKCFANSSLLKTVSCKRNWAERWLRKVAYGCSFCSSAELFFICTTRTIIFHEKQQPRESYQVFKSEILSEDGDWQFQFNSFMLVVRPGPAFRIEIFQNCVLVTFHNSDLQWKCPNF